MSMGKYILFAATRMNWGMICGNSGEWRNTKYVVYSDGTCWTVSTYDEDPNRRSILPEELRRMEQRPRTCRMEEGDFQRLKYLLDNSFHMSNSVKGCDGDGWEMHHYAPGGKCLHSIHGHIHGVSVLEEIKELLIKC